MLINHINNNIDLLDIMQKQNIKHLLFSIKTVTCTHLTLKNAFRFRKNFKASYTSLCGF